ncbi:helix-turn-helix domain-containing protein [Streptomyces sp. NPDC019531]|uniref:helix-turn-helix domain-containing protein n=1 Tax=Streptomyces sp. NPDC019531 TaxID=3365062 RepID=UPI00384D7B05
MSQTPVNWRYSGNQMKRWRIKANVSREELGAASNYSPDTIKSMEQGVRMPTPRVLDVADELPGGGPAQRGQGVSPEGEVSGAGAGLHGAGA